MTEKNKEQLSRRDALKVLGAAAGATALANLPHKWNSPELLSGVLPAHAQTSAPVCVDYALTIEVLSGSFVFTLNDGPSPDLESGEGGPGTIKSWVCQEGCLFFWFDLSEIIGSGSVRFVTMAGEYLENYDDTNAIRDVVVELGTGAISIRSDESGGTAGACVYEGIPLDQVQPDGLRRSRR